MAAPAIDRSMVAKLTAEAIGTFALCFVGILSLTHGVFGGTSLVGAALAHGLTIAVMASAFMLVSGGQFNPAVTLALWLAKQMSGRDSLMFAAAQLVAGILGALAAQLAIDGAITDGVPEVANGTTMAAALLVEALLTFFLVLVIFGTAIDPAFGARIGGLAIGLAVTLGILAGGPLTGAAMNPARWFGPALVDGDLSGAVIYLAGPLVGGVAASLVYAKVIRPGLAPARLD